MKERNNELENFLKNKELNIELVEPILENLSKEMVNYISIGIESYTIKSVRENYVYLSNLSKELGISSNSERQKVYILGFVKAILDIDKVVCDKRVATKELEATGEFNEDIFKVLEILCERNNIFYSDIVSTVNLPQKTLDIILNELVNKSIVKYREYADLKIYSATQKTRQLHVLYCEKKNSINDMSKYEDFLLQLLDNLYTCIAKSEPSMKCIANEFEEFSDSIYISKKKALKGKIEKIIFASKLEKKQTTQYLGYDYNIITCTESEYIAFEPSAEEDNENVYLNIRERNGRL